MIVTSRRTRLLGIVASAWLVQPSSAAWLEARTHHFVIEANTTEIRLRDFALRLERFDGALRTIYRVPDDPARWANPVLVIVTDPATIARFAGSANVAGFYRPRADRPVIFSVTLDKGPEYTAPIGSLIKTVKRNTLTAQPVLLHEYSHHFLYTSFPKIYPMWFSEGFSEFNGNVVFNTDNTIVIGAVPAYRKRVLDSGLQLSIEQLLDPPASIFKDPLKVDLLYGRGWLLTHYVMVEGRKSKELARYIDLMNEGRSSIEAAKAAFGDLHHLSGEIDKLLGAQNLSGLAVKAMADPVVTIRTLSAGAAAMMPVQMGAMAGVTRERALQVAREAEKLAASFSDGAPDDAPDDAVMQRELAEAELDAGRLELADAAADRVLQANPKDIRALVFKGRIAMKRLMRRSEKDPALWKAARGWYVQANHLGPNEAEPLRLYYASYLAEGASPPELASRGLLRAQQLAPQDPSISLLVAIHLIDDAQTETALAVLQPLLYDPHGDAAMSGVRRAVEALGKGDKDAARDAIVRELAESLTGDG